MTVKREREETNEQSFCCEDHVDSNISPKRLKKDGEEDVNNNNNKKKKKNEEEESKIEAFIQLLVDCPPMKNCFNPYNSGNESHDTTRKNNLRIYLSKILALNPQMALIGEAPGYRGCHWSGVPLCSEWIMMKEYDPTESFHMSLLFGPSKGYQKTSYQPDGYKEATATSLWDILSRILPTDDESVLPVLWNSCFVQTHQPGNEKKNRNPNNKELDALLHILRYFFSELLPTITTVICLGRKAEYSMQQLRTDPQFSHLKFTYVRHPSQGGKPLCESGLRSILSNQ